MFSCECETLCVPLEQPLYIAHNMLFDVSSLYKHTQKQNMEIWFSYFSAHVYFRAVTVCGTIPISSGTDVTLFEMQITA